ncbi:MAG TPA: hypothetical protein LFV66_01165 [Rickettsia endosymbiont of Bembidion lapponicum]|nr:hypothetical protein [Rickettsia endosymbiont of Bembidion lapponicum]
MPEEDQKAKVVRDYINKWDDDKKKWEKDHKNGSHDSGDGKLLGTLIVIGC